MALVLMVASFAVPAQAWAKDASADIDQCANGPLAAVAPCQGSAWQNGNLNANQAHWFEGDSVPYRLKLADLVVGQQYVATIEWDTTKSGKHALDYLTSYDRTETTGAADPAHYHANQNNACSDYLSASDCAAPSTLAIPADPNIPSSITPAAGAFTVWGGTLDSTSGYTVSGDYSGDSSTSIDIAFTASDTAAVLAWGGHIALRQDWGVGNSAIAIPGSPYHMRLLNLNPPNRRRNQ